MSERTSERDIVVRQPAGKASALVLLFHGVGASPEGLVPLGELIADALPGAAVVSVCSPAPSDLGGGYQWFSVRGVDEANRPARVDAAMPAFAQTVRDWQARTGVAPDATTLLGFSQGAIMALEATQRVPGLASRVVALAGRFAEPPQTAPGAAVHWLHGEQDGVIPAAWAGQGVAQLRALGAAVTLDLVPGLGHGVDARMARQVLERLAPPPNPEPS